MTSRHLLRLLLAGLLATTLGASACTGDPSGENNDTDSGNVDGDDTGETPDTGDFKTCADGTIVAADATCTKTCLSGATVDEGAECVKTCLDGSEIPEDAQCLKDCDDGTPVPEDETCGVEMQTCPDGSMIPVDQTCPVDMPDAGLDAQEEMDMGPELRDCSGGVQVVVGTQCPEEVDTDFDGIPDVDEALLCTDPLNNDSDEDGLGDLAELQGGTDPCDPDSDGDGLDDVDELYFGFDPNDSDSQDDGIRDGDRFIVAACEDPEAEAVVYSKSNEGDWLIALPATFGNYAVLNITNSPPYPTATGVYDDPVNEVAAFVLSEPKTGNRDAISQLLTYYNKIDGVGNIDQDLTEGVFTTHDGFEAAPGTYEITVSAQTNVRDVRNRMLFALANGFNAADVTGLPAAAGNNYSRYYVRVSVIEREDRFITSFAVTPQQLFEQRDSVKFRMSDLTNTTNVAQAGDGNELTCHPFPASTQIPKADFYWVLDQSGSMDPYFVSIQSFANDFYTRLLNSALDFRLGVTPMEKDFGGKLRAPNPGWHDDPQTFSSEIQDYIIRCDEDIPNCSVFEEHGLYAARAGVEYMRLASTPQAVRIRPDAQLATILISDEQDQSLKNGNDPGGSSVGRTQLLNNYKNFFTNNPVVFAIVSQTGCGEQANGYRDVALASGGAVADLCPAEDNPAVLQSTIEQIIEIVAGRASTFRLPETPISSTLRVYRANTDGVTEQWVPRSRSDGFDYFPQSNSIAFFGSYRPKSGGETCTSNAVCGEGGLCEQGKCKFPVQIAVHYETFLDKTKTPPTPPAP